MKRIPANIEDAGRLRRALARRRGITEKRMFGGVCFLLRENMLCLWSKRGLLFRVGPEQEREALRRPGAKPMIHAGRRMRGFVRVDPQACDARQIKRWIVLAERYVSGLPAAFRRVRR